MLTALLLALSAISPAPNASPHSNSISVSRIEVEGSRLRHRIELQTLSILEVLPELDLDGDGELNPSELELGRAPLGEYLDSAYTLFAASTSELPAPAQVSEVRESAASDPASPFSLQRISLQRTYELNAPLRSLAIEVSVFGVTSPDHRDFCTLAWEGQFEEEWLFSAGKPLWEYTPDPELSTRIFEAYLWRGCRRFFAFEVCSLLLLLMAACPSRRQASRVLFAYLLCIGAGACAALLFGRLLSPRILELTLILAIPYVAAENAMHRGPRTPRIEAGLFGVVLGISLVQTILLNLEQIPTMSGALLGHALGFFVSLFLTAGALLLLLPRLGGERSPADALAPNWLRGRGSILFALLGLGWFVQNAWFVNG